MRHAAGGQVCVAPHRTRLRVKRKPVRETGASPYTDQGQDYYEQRYRERVLRALSQRAARLGMKMVPTEQPA